VFFPKVNLYNEHLVVDKCCDRIVGLLRRFGLYAHSTRERLGWKWLKCDGSIESYCKARGAILVTKDHELARSAREEGIRVIELWFLKNALHPHEEAYLVLSKLGFNMHHFMLITGIHINRIFNWYTNGKPIVIVNRPKRDGNIKGFDPLFGMPLTHEQIDLPLSHSYKYLMMTRM